MVNYAWTEQSQRKLWWKFAAPLTCKLSVGSGHRGERPIEPSSSWFLPNFPAGLLEPRQFYQVKLMIRRGAAPSRGCLAPLRERNLP